VCLLFLGAVLGLEGVKAVGLYFVGLSAQNEFRDKTHAEGRNTLEMIRATQQPTLTTVSMKSKYNCVFLFGRETKKRAQSLLERKTHETAHAGVSHVL
jgi:tRNA(Leu) C34 or U34 (ribose-2'-O)-methylase TrmL